eukprot:2082373-Pleurochrysis_carterae.AAC.1
MCSDSSRMNFRLAGLQLQNGLFMSKLRTVSSDAVQLGENAPSRCSKRPARFQWSAGSGKGAMSLVVWMTIAAMMPFRL